MVRDGLLSASQGQEVLSRRRNETQAKLHPFEYLAELELDNQANPGQPLDLGTMSRWLAESAQQPYYHIDPLKIDAASVTPLMSLAYAERHQILAVEVNENEILVASAQPWHRGWEDNLKHINRREIKRVVSNPAEIRRYTGEFYKLAKSITGASKEGGINAINTGNLEQLLQLGDAQTPDANDQHIINIVDWLLQYAFDQRASDIHIEPRRDKGHIRFRIDGVLHTVYDMPAQVLAAVNSRLKILGRMNVAEKRKPQDGRLKTRSTEGSEVELRISTLPTAFGEKMVMRIFDPDVLLKGFHDLGFSKDDDKRWHQMVSRPSGIVLVTGPTGSGKTTTLYSTLKELATSRVNVCTIEDPIEMVEPSFNQMQVQHNIDLTFASGVRALLRQDPDIIMVGEIRDLETAEMAIQAALTGHLVLSTLHTNDAPSAITRLLELGVPDYLIRATVLGVMAQRLVRTLCPDCKAPAPIDKQAWKELTRPWVAEPPSMGAKAVGCLNCRQTGFRGRAGVYEIMPLEGVVRDQLGERTDVDKMRSAAIRNGMHTLRLSGAQKVAAGLTTVDEVLRVTPVTTLS
ncbi:GspE/PulE family protein [Sansalvadorimonas verongulae]|uniref:GspE/PulE family protein n=1 Tax=Sansalvadorimonas verongulae TaxID=2172824 RepID=UPI0038B53F7D